MAMKVIIATPFRDKNRFSRLFQVGEIVEFDEERAKHIIRLGYASPFEPEESPEKEAPKESEEAEKENPQETFENADEVNTETAEVEEGKEADASETPAPKRGRKPKNE